MPLDPGIADYLARVAADVPPLASTTPAARRTRMELVARRFPAPEDAVARGDAWIVLPGREVAVRMYRPRAGTLPAIVYLHGGGWVAGSLATHDGPCAALARDADARRRERALPARAREPVPGAERRRVRGARMARRARARRSTSTRRASRSRATAPARTSRSAARSKRATAAGRASRSSSSSIRWSSRRSTRARTASTRRRRRSRATT